MTLYLSLHKTLFYLEKHCDELLIINLTVAINVRFRKVKQNRKFTFKGVMGQLCVGKIILVHGLFDPHSFIDKFLKETSISYTAILQTDSDFTWHSSVDNFSPSFCKTSCRSGTVIKPWPSLSNTLQCNTLLGGQTGHQTSDWSPLNSNYQIKYTLCLKTTT